MTKNFSRQTSGAITADNKGMKKDSLPAGYTLTDSGSRPNPCDSIIESAEAHSKTFETDGPTSQLPSEPPAPPPIVSLDDAALGPERWQAPRVLKKCGVLVSVVPPGAALIAIAGFFTAFFAGRTAVPFGYAHYPGDVLFATNSPGLDSAMRAALTSFPQGRHRVLLHRMESRFNWKKPLALPDAIKDTVRRGTAAVIIDTGHYPQRVDEKAVDATYAELSKLATEADCLMVLLVEASSTSINPFERIPRSLRSIRGPLLTVPLRSKALAPKPLDTAQFLLMRLPEASPNAVVARFSLMPSDDLVETANIWWEAGISFGNPLEVFRQAETRDLSDAQRKAAQLAHEIILARGPTTNKDLQAAGHVIH